MVRKSKFVTIPAPVLMLYTGKKKDPVWMDRTWLPAFFDQINKILDENAIYESLISFKRAGASAIVTYFADQIADKLR